MAFSPRPEAISAIPNPGAIQLSFPSFPAPGLLEELIKPSQLIPVQVNSFQT